MNLPGAEAARPAGSGRAKAKQAARGESSLIELKFLKPVDSCWGSGRQMHDVNSLILSGIVVVSKANNLSRG